MSEMPFEPTPIRHATPELATSAPMNASPVNGAARYRRGAAPGARSGATEPLQQLFERFADPLLVVDARRRILLRNEISIRVLASRAGIANRADTLIFDDRDAASRLDRILATPAGAAQAHEARAVRARAPAPGRDWLVMVLSLRIREFSEPAFLLHLVRRAAERHLPRRALQDLYGLTRKETEVVGHLVGGTSLRAAAAALGLSYGTIRVYLKQIFFKCEVSSQAELAVLLQRLALLADFDPPEPERKSSPLILSPPIWGLCGKGSG